MTRTSETIIVLAVQIATLVTCVSCAVIKRLPDVIPPWTTTPTTTTTTTTQPPKPPAWEPVACKCAGLSKPLAAPESWGVECPTPNGWDVRFTANLERLNTGKPFKFIGDPAAKFVQCRKNADGKRELFLPCFDYDGYRVHVVGWNAPRVAEPVQPGNLGTWNGDGTFRFHCTIHTVTQ